MDSTEQLEDEDLHQVDSVLDLASTSSTVSSIFGSDDVPSSSGDISAASSSSGEIPSALLAVPPRLVVGPPAPEAATVAVSGRVKCVGRNNKGLTWGSTSVIGRRREMEDAVAVVPGFMTRTCDHVGGCTAPGSRSSGEISPLQVPISVMQELLCKSYKSISDTQSQFTTHSQMGEPIFEKRFRLDIAH